MACACAPALDWREVRPQGSGVAMLFPCRPVGHTRDVPLGGSSVSMTVHACRAADALYALGVADVGDPRRVTPALQQLRESASTNLGARSAEALPLTVRGSTPNAQAGAWRFDGRRPDGVPARQVVAVFAGGTRVFQASVLGTPAEADAVRTFLDGLRVGQ